MEIAGVVLDNLAKGLLWLTLSIGWYLFHSTWAKRKRKLNDLDSYDKTTTTPRNWLIIGTSALIGISQIIKHFY